ncbi:MAG: helix-turn-helix transcriptional regulator [Clostridiales bacterium]|nr:helix-turn-helix transcriptional regulator [Clostridiales bacterium]
MEFKIKTLSDEFKITGIANVHFFEFDKNFATEVDKHPFYELVYVSKGSLKVKSEDYSGTLEKNNLIIHRPDEYHSLISEEKNSATVIIIGFTCEGLPALFSSKVISLSDSNIKKLAEAVKEGRNVFAPPHNVPVYDMKKNKHKIYGSEQMLKITLEHFFLNIIREHYITSKQENFPTKFNVNEIISYLDDKYKEKITLGELAFIFGTNRTTLCKEFKNATGTTVLDYVGDKKIEDAKRKIKDTNATFTEISIELNFESIHYFTKFFKKKTGLTPKEFRRLYRKK